MSLTEVGVSNKLQDVHKDAEENWQRVVEYLRTTALESIQVDERTTLGLLYEDFWPTHVALLEREELSRPGITETIFLTESETPRLLG